MPAILVVPGMPALAGADPFAASHLGVCSDRRRQGAVVAGSVHGGPGADDGAGSSVDIASYCRAAGDLRVAADDRADTDLVIVAYADAGLEHHVVAGRRTLSEADASAEGRVAGDLSEASDPDSRTESRQPSDAGEFADPRLASNPGSGFQARALPEFHVVADTGGGVASRAAGAFLIDAGGLDLGSPGQDLAGSSCVAFRDVRRVLDDRARAEGGSPSDAGLLTDPTFGSDQARLADLRFAVDVGARADLGAPFDPRRLSDPGTGADPDLLLDACGGFDDGLLLDEGSGPDSGPVAVPTAFFE